MKLEINKNALDDSLTDSLKDMGILITPAVGESYWVARVKIPNSRNYIQTFPKFMTYGIGFAKEKDWNTNLPYTCDAEQIYKHIEHNKPKKALKENCIQAIGLLQKYIKENLK